MNSDKIEPTIFLKACLWISSIMILFIVAISVYISPENRNLFSAACLTIPATSFYIKGKCIKLIFSYIIIDLHLIFWAFLSLLTISSNTGGVFMAPFVMVVFFVIVLFRRKSNFRVKTWQPLQT